MKTIIIVVIIGVIVIGAMIMMRPAPVQNVSIDFDDVIIIESVPPSVDLKPWAGLDCTEMLDFSGTVDHNLMNDSLHIEFHEHYMNSCSDIEVIDNESSFISEKGQLVETYPNLGVKVETISKNLSRNRI